MTLPVHPNIVRRSHPRIVFQDVAHFARKLRSTVRIVWTLAMARTFGRYQHTVGGGDFDYAVYVWRGITWAIPTTPIDEDAAVVIRPRRTHPADTFGFAVCLLSLLAVGGVFIWRYL